MMIFIDADYDEDDICIFSLFFLIVVVPMIVLAIVVVLIVVEADASNSFRVEDHTRNGCIYIRVDPIRAASAIQTAGAMWAGGAVQAT